MRIMFNGRHLLSIEDQRKEMLRILHTNWATLRKYYSLMKCKNIPNEIQRKVIMRCIFRTKPSVVGLGY